MNTENRPMTEESLLGTIQHLIIENGFNLDDFMNNMTRTTRPNSFVDQIAGLKPGESISRVRGVDPTMTVERMPDEMPALREQVRNLCQPALARARQVVKDAEYTCEVGTMVMPAGSIFIVGVITRTE